MAGRDSARAGNTIIEGDTIRLDYGTFKNQAFVGCRLIYGGGGVPIIDTCDFIDSSFILDGAALSTAQFLGGLASGGAESRELVLSMIGLK